jgi:hypothetical protein
LFLQPLRKRRIVPENDVGQLFSTLPAIISLNKALLSAVVGSYTQTEAYNRSIDATVSSLVQNNKSSGGARGFSAIMTARGLMSLTSVKRKECLIADAFQQMASYLKVYTTYSARYVDAVAIIKRHRAANPAFGAFLDEVKGAPECRGRDMKTLMLRPVQRLCQYITVLDDLVRCTPRAHGDYDLLVQTAARIQDIARSAEESLLTLQMAAKDADEETNTPTNGNNTTSLRGSRGSSSSSRRRKSSMSEERGSRVERRRDSLADLPNVMLEPKAAAATDATTTQDASRQPKRQVSWRFSLSRMSTGGGHAQRSFSVGDSGNVAGSESLLSLLEREKQRSASVVTGAITKGGSAGSGSGSRRQRGLKRGGSLTNNVTIKAEPRRVNSAVSLCRCESATGVTFKGGLVC